MTWYGKSTTRPSQSPGTRNAGRKGSARLSQLSGRGDAGSQGKTPVAPSRTQQHAGWIVLNYLIAGMLVYGGLGWLIGYWTGYPIIFPLGMLAGIGLSVGLIIFRFGRP